MIKVLTTRPLYWDGLQTDKMIIKTVEIGNKLRNGTTMPEGIGTLMFNEGKQKLLIAFEEFKPDVFIFVTHFGLFTLEFLQQIKWKYSKTVFIHWSGNQVLDKVHNLCWYTYEMKSCIDVVLTNNKDPERIKLISSQIKKVFTLYDFGFDPLLFTAPQKEAEIECFFGGGNSVRLNKPKGTFPHSMLRRDILTKINKLYNLEVRGGGWAFGTFGKLHGLQYFKTIQRAKITLGINHLDLERYYTKRTFFFGASGRMYLVYYIPGMEKDFENHKNIVWYKTEQECFSFLKYYLINEGERETIAKNQREHFIKYHSWIPRLNDLNSIIERIVQ